MDYYAFEYSILQKLQDIFDINSIEISRNEVNAVARSRNSFGKLSDVIVQKFTIDNIIELTFTKDFKIIFSRKDLMKKFNNDCAPEEVVNDIRKYIEKQYLKQIYR